MAGFSGSRSKEGMRHEATSIEDGEDSDRKGSGAIG